MSDRTTRGIRIIWPRGEVIAVLDDTTTAVAVFETLPVEAEASTWGEEVYFRVPANARLDPDARQVVDAGTVCFWVQGSSLVLPFGPTPASHGDECRLATPVNVIGRLEGDPRALASVKRGDRIRVEPI